MVEFKQLIVLLKQLMAELGQMTVELPFGRYMMNNDETVGFLGKIIAHYGRSQETFWKLQLNLG